MSKIGQMKSEAKIQADCFRWFHNSFKELRGCLFHVPNGGARSKAEAGTLKATGVIAGVPDMIFLYYGRCIFIEMKRPGEKPRPEQRALHDLYKAHAFRVEVCDNLNQFQTIIMSEIEQQYWIYDKQTGTIIKLTALQAGALAKAVNFGPVLEGDNSTPEDMLEVIRGTYPLKRDQLEYEQNIFKWLFDLQPGKWAIESVVSNEYRPRFLNVVKKFIIIGLPEANGFTLELDGTASAGDHNHINKFANDL